MNMYENPVIVIEKAKRIAKSKYPYLGRIISVISVVKHETTEIDGALAIDKGMRLYWRADLLRQMFQRGQGWNWDDLAEAIVHEARHILSRHFDRCGGRDTRLWNIATDMEINDDLHFQVAPVILPSAFGFEDGMPAEFYYDKLAQQGQGQQRQRQQHAQQRQGGQGQQGQQGQGQQQGQQQGQGGQQQGQQGGQQQGQQQGQGGQQQGQQGQRFCGGGSGVTGRKESWELSDDDKETPAASRSQVDATIKATIEDIRSHRSKGNVPAWAERLVEEWERMRQAWRRVNYERLIQRVVSTVGMEVLGRGNGIDWRRRNRRIRIEPFVFPASVKRLPKALIVIDTSGSMSDVDLSTCLAGVERGLKALGGYVKVAAWDCELKAIKEVKKVREAAKLLKGGGGTSMKDAIEWAEKQKDVQLIIVMTDGETDWVDRKPTVKTIIFIINNPSALNSVPDFLKADAYAIEVR